MGGLQNMLRRFMQRFSYEQKYYIVVSIGMIAYVIIVGALIAKDQREIRNIDIQMLGHRYEIPLRQLMEHLPRHQLLASRYLSGDVGVRGELMTTQGKVSDAFRKLQKLEESQGDLFIENPFDEGLEQTDSPHFSALTKKWDTLQSEIYDLTPQGSTSFHTQLIHELRDLIHYVGDTSIVSQSSSKKAFYAIEMTLIKLPEVQQLLTTLINEAESSLKQGALSPEQRGEMIADLSLLQANLERSQLGMGRQLSNLRKEGHKEYIFTLFSAYTDDMENLLSYIKKQFLNVSKPTANLNDLLEYGTKAQESAFLFWDAAVEDLNSELEKQKNSIILNTITTFLFAFFFLVVSFFLGLFFVKNLSKSILNLRSSMESFSEGDLKARATIFYDDEAGRMASSFNLLAAHFETVIHDLNRLLSAIKDLSAGEFSTRLEIPDTQSEVGKVAQSFNQMAQTFGDIVGQLRDLGINLATSATQITAASKQQELVITEQEATTREISVTANQISTTSQEFANTMNEISVVAEQTAKLAATGKTNLDQMQNIMRQMVNASQSIASRLAILNEKAQNITTVVTTITKVADQTNLLSLNASIEAEKAGEFGKSFAVIAREIRRLADLTAFATLDIEKIVEEIMTAVSSSVSGVEDFTGEIKQGVNEVGQVAGQLNTIIEQVQVVSSRFEGVNQGMQAQAVGAEQINDAISELNQSARETSMSLSGFRQTLQSLTIAAGDLKNAVDRIKKENLMDHFSTLEIDQTTPE